MRDGSDLTLHIPDPGHWVTYQWVTSNHSNASVSCREATGILSIKNVGAVDGGYCWCETELVYEKPAATERLIFKLQLNRENPMDKGTFSREGWFQVNQEEPKPFTTFSPNDYPCLAGLMQQVCGRELFTLAGRVERFESLGSKATAYARGQIECNGITSATYHEMPFASEQTLQIITKRTIWRANAIPFLGLVESQLNVNPRLKDATENDGEYGWTSALYLSDFGVGALSGMRIA